jgi:phosphatidylglycerophosphatase A
MKLRLNKEKNPVNEDYKVPFIVKALGSGLFVGYIPFASGTFGSLLGLVIFLLPDFAQLHVLAIALVICLIVGIYVSEVMQKRYGEDPPEVVIDEIAGLWTTYLVGYLIFEFFFKAKTFDPTFYFSTKILFGIVGFIIFRIFDIVKLQPAGYFDGLKNGYGIMMDDIVAGLYAGIISPVITHFLWYRLIVKIVG